MIEKKLSEIIVNVIKKNGPIPFSKYMDLCLYHPEYGYYRQKRPPIGKIGDYYTNPCVHKIFGYILAKHIIEIFDNIHDDELYIIEGGAGSGYLLRDIGEFFFNSNPEILDKINIIIIEPNKYYREIQFNSFSNFFKNITFIDTPDKLPEFNGIFYSNELFDSMPVEILQTDYKGIIRQVFVDFQGDKFVEVLDNPDKEVISFLKKWHINIPENFRTEVSLAVESFYNQVVRRIKQGAVLTIDYGYPRTELFDNSHNRGTLMCYYKHTANENPYVRTGIQDITFHIDFTLLKDVGEQAGMETVGYIEQSYFLMGTGIIEELENIKRENFENYQREIIKIKNLLLPGGMGDTFKFFEQTKNMSFIPRGFSIKNKMKLL